jgi:putative acetyltransferase
LPQIRQARSSDHTEISVLLVSAFDQTNEARLIEELRACGAVATELVAMTEDGICGHICLSRLLAPQGWLTVAPVAVRDADRNKGIGGELIRYALDDARQKRAKAVVVVGDPEYYNRFGFVFDGPARLTTPYPSQYTGLYPIDPATARAQVALAYPKPFETV